MKPSLVVLGAIATLGLSACASDPDRVPQSQRTWTPQGDPVSCIPLRNVRSTNVPDDRTINFVINNNRMFRNDLPMSCPGLGFNRAFKHNSRSGQLCSANTITVIQPGAGSGQRGPTCGLGRFQPMVPTDTLPPAGLTNPPPPAK
jgi:Family of unknown function (DUF6491)